MSGYRAYLVDVDGHIKKAVELDCPDENGALESAAQLVDGYDPALSTRNKRTRLMLVIRWTCTIWCFGARSLKCVPPN